MKRKYSLVIQNFLFFCLYWSQPTLAQITVETTSGTITGIQSIDGTYDQFLGVPYAEPPTDLNRFRPPMQKIRSEEPYQAISYGPACMQDTQTLDSIILNAETTEDDLRLTAVTESEDCLYLNIYAPRPNATSDELHPVMIFIHGGDFVSGTGAIYQGSNFATNYDVILININYRLGAFGFLSNGTNEIEGNYGLLDQKMAINWVKENIHAFGGDPNSITLFGDEAGGSSVHIHLLESENPGFHNAIIQSPQYDDGVWTKRKCDDQFEEFLSLLNLNPDTVDLGLVLRNIDTNAIKGASLAMKNWKPCIHSNIITESPNVLMKDDNFTTSVNLLIGTDNAAGSEKNIDVSDDDWLYNFTSQLIEDTFPQLYGNVSNNDIKRMSQTYLQYYSTNQKSVITGTYQRSLFASTAYGDQYYMTWSDEISRKTNPKCDCSIYEYLFTKPTETNDPVQRRGALLSSELPYLFGFVDTDQPLSDAMMTYWTNFAKSGNPNTPLSVATQWPRYEATNDSSQDCRLAIELDSDVGNEVIASRYVKSRSWDFWQEYYKALGFSCMTGDGWTEESELISDAEECEPTVEYYTGMAISNETAGIMLIVFIAVAAVFLLTTIIAVVCCCKYKKKLKKEKKKKKERREGHDNPASLYKL